MNKKRPTKANPKHQPVPEKVSHIEAPVPEEVNPKHQPVRDDDDEPKPVPEALLRRTGNAIAGLAKAMHPTRDTPPRIKVELFDEIGYWYERTEYGGDRKHIEQFPTAEMAACCIASVMSRGRWESLAAPLAELMASIQAIQAHITKPWRDDGDTWFTTDEPEPEILHQARAICLQLNNDWEYILRDWLYATGLYDGLTGLTGYPPPIDMESDDDQIRFYVQFLAAYRCELDEDDPSTVLYTVDVIDFDEVEEHLGRGKTPEEALADAIQYVRRSHHARDSYLVEYRDQQTKGLLSEDKIELLRRLTKLAAKENS